MPTSQYKYSANVVIVGAGRGGTALLKIIDNDPSIHLIGIVDINPDAPGLAIAKKMGIPIAKYVHSFFDKPDVKIDILIEVTGNEKIHKELQAIKPSETRMIGGIAAKFIWALIEARRDKQIIEQKYVSF